MTRRPSQPTGDATRRRANRAFQSPRKRPRPPRDPPLSFVAPVLPVSDPEVRRALAGERRTWQVQQARRFYLERVAALAPDVLRELDAVRRNTAFTEAITDWARRYGFDRPWALVVAQHTVTLWDTWPAGRGRVWDLSLDDTGALVPARGRLPHRPPERTFRPEHFDWTVRRVVLRDPPSQIGPATTVRRAVTRLAEYLDLPISLPRRRK